MADFSSLQNPWDGIKSGYGFGNALRTDRARTVAGNALTGGDYGTAAGALLGSGDLNAGVRVQQLGQEQAAATAKIAKDHEEEGAKLISDFAGRAYNLHDANKDTAQTLAAFDEFAPHLAKYDSPEEIAKVREHLAANPEATLVGLGAGAAKKLGLEVRNAGDEVIVLDPNQGGKEVRRYRGAKTVNVAEGGALYEIPGAGDPSPPGDVHDAPPAHAAAAPAMAPTSAPGALHPDAVWKSIHTQESGGDPTPGDAVGPDTAYGHALGSTQMLPATAEAMARKLGIAWNPALLRENSQRALEYQDKLGRAYFDEGLQKSGGDPAGAAAYYFGGPDPKLHGPKTRAYVEQVMNRASAGSQPYEVAANGATPPPPSAPGAPRLLISRPKPADWHSDGKGNLINANGDRKVDPTATIDTSQADPNVVKAVLEGRYPVPTGRAATDPKWQAVLAAAAEQDPQFNAADYATRVATRKDFTSGKASTNITALNTAIGHVGSLYEKIDGLGNTFFTPYNALKNYAENKMGDPRLKTFDTDKKAVASEITRVFRQTGGTAEDLKDFQTAMDAAGSPAQLKSVAKEMLTLLTSRLDAMATQYSQGLGQTKDGLAFLNPHTAKVYTKVTGIPVSAMGRPEQESTPAPANGLPSQARAQLKADHVTTFANGQKWTLRNGQPVQVK